MDFALPVFVRVSPILAALVVASLALIHTQSERAYADGICSNRAHTAYELTLGATGYNISAVRVTDIASECIGGPIVVTLNAGANVVGTGSASVTATEMVVPIPEQPPAQSVTKVTVQLVILVGTPTPTVEPGAEEPLPVASPSPVVASPKPEASPEPHEEDTGPDDDFGDLPVPVTPPATAAVSATPDAGTPTPVIVAQVPPVTPTPTPPPPPATPTPQPRPKFEPELLTNIPSISDISTDPAAILSNAGLSAGLLTLMLIDTTIFNAILKENAFLIQSFVRRRLGWLRALFGGPTHLFSTKPVRYPLLKPFIVLSLSALIYSLLDPNFGLNNSSLVLFLSLFFGLAIATYVNDGGQVLVAERRYRIPFSLQFFPAAIGVAIVSIVVSRLVDIHPGIIFGFVAGAREASAHEPTDDEDGVINFLPMASLLAVSVLAWLAIGPVDSIAGGDTFIGTVVEASCAMLFVGSIQGLLFTLLPFQFMDGQKVWQWSKLAWLSLALPVGFLFFHTVLNKGATLASASSSHGVVALYCSAIFAWAVTLIAWFYFHHINPPGSHSLEEEFEDVAP
jgi:hypothetical protein